MKFLSLAIVMYRMRVGNTKLPYLWMFLPPLMRILPFVLILGAVSESQKAIGYVAIYFSFTSASVYVRRGFRLNAIFPKRVPVWIANSMDLTLAARTFACMSAMENFPAVLLIAIGIGSASLSPMVAVEVFSLIMVLTITTHWLGFRILPFLIIKNELMADVKQSLRYIFLGLTSLMIIIFTISSNIPNLILLLAPFGHFPLLINAFYGDSLSFFLGLTNVSFFSVILMAVTRRYSWKNVADLQSKNRDDELEVA